LDHGVRLLRYATPPTLPEAIHRNRPSERASRAIAVASDVVNLAEGHGEHA
jgi:hypothetical protein